MEEVKYNPRTYKPNISNGLFIGFGKSLTNENEPVIPIYVPWKDLNGHTIVFGTTRVGKTRLMMSFVDQMIEAGMDLIIVDPKGSKGQEIIGWVLEYLEKHGKLTSFKYTSPMFAEMSMLFNPLFYLTNDEIKSLVKNIIQADEEFYKNMGADVSYAIALALEYIEKTMNPELIKDKIREAYLALENHGNIADEINNIINPDLAERVANPQKPEGGELDTPPLRKLMTFADIERYSSKEGCTELLDYINGLNEELIEVELTAELQSLRRQAIVNLEKIIKKPDDYFIKVGSSYESVISQLSNGQVGKILSIIKVNPIIDALYDTTKSSVIVVQPFPLVFSEASDTLVKMFFNMLSSLFGRIGASGRGLPRQVGLLVDEGGAVLYEGVKDLFNKAGGLGLRLMIFTQSFSDIDDAVGEDVSRIISDNSNVKIYLRMNDEQSRERVSKAFGVKKQLSDSSGGTKRDVRSMVQRTEENILNDSHVSELPNQTFLFQHGPRKYLIRGPFVPDPKCFIKMPKLISEITLDEADLIREEFLAKKLTNN